MNYSKIIELILEEKTNLEISEELNYSIGMIKYALSYMYKFYNVKGKIGLIREYYLGNIEFIED